MRFEKDGPSAAGAKCFNCGGIPQARWEGGEGDVHVCHACATRVLPALIADAVFVSGGVTAVSDHRKHLDAVRAAYWEAAACRMRPRPGAAPPGPPDLALWEIRGEASCDSNGGEETVWVFAPDDAATPPDPDAAIARAYGGKYAWYRIDSVRRVADIPTAFPGHPGGYADIERALALIRDEAQ